MESPAAVSDLERRKKVRVRLRPDLSITPQRYEGRIYYVVKDPVCLRYYRFKEQERFLLNLMDGKHTLDDSQKAFEQRFRPERLTLEDLEGFTSQLLQAGLAQNETPNAGKQLYDRFKKRRRQLWTSALLNILYIKIPIYDPDRLLKWMNKGLNWMFTTWFLVASVLVMLSALGLILSHWATFVTKLPSAHEFFTFQTVMYVWVALGLVKIIHEFGHGLSCKAFGGEVHEMGALLLVFSPCLYCNVSDAWTLPNKWKRIIISAAGIYVELIIASFATFIWWNTDNGSMINNLCLSLIIVCSVSTIIFNANPLMRFDGYYVMADWLEIPNLRDRCNKYLQNVAMEVLLGIEVQPEPYMAARRKVLFITYAVVSYLYRWVVTFSILYFMYTFLKPYKLGALSFLLGTGAVGTMVGYPAYRLIRAVHRRGRIPDMKPVRVGFTVAICTTALILLLTIPFPMHVKGLALVQVDPAHVKRVVIPDVEGILTELLVEDGEFVHAGDKIAVLENPDVEIRLKMAISDYNLRSALLRELSALENPKAAAERQSAHAEMGGLATQIKLMKAQREHMVLRAPRDGRVMRLIPKDERGKYQPKGTLVCEIGDEYELRAILLVEPHDSSLVSENDVAWIRIHGRGYNYFPGHVANISALEMKEMPPQLSNKAHGDVPTQTDPQTHMEVPQHQHYLIAVRFDRDRLDDGIQPGVMSRVKIEVPSQTLWWRFRRYLATTFNWGL